MHVRRLICLPILTLGSMFLSGQGPRYHSDLLHSEADRSGGAWVVLVNDSETAIEAFHIRASLCPGTSESSYDYLEHPGGISGTHLGLPFGSAPPGALQQQNDIVRPGGKMITLTHLPPSHDHCNGGGKIDPVIFSDGTFVGDKGTARGMQAYRDGIAAAVRYWQNKAHIGGTTAQALRQEAKTHAEKLQGKACQVYMGNVDHSTGCEYFTGLAHTEMNIASLGNRSQGEEGDLRSVVKQLDEWLGKIDGDEALKKLETVFPLPDKFIKNSPWPK